MNNISTRQKALFWVASLLLAYLFVAAVSDILLPFVVGMLVAYFLDPVADRLEGVGFSRTLATALIIVSFFSLVLIGAALLMPVLYDQLMALAKKLPQYISLFQERYGAKIEEWLAHVNQSAPENVEEKAVSASRAILQYSAKFAGSVWESGVALLNLVSLLFISPVVAFYMLRDFDKMKTKVNGWLPRDNAKTIRMLFGQMDDTLAGFIRGVSNVCLLLGVFYAIGLSLVGLDFGLLIGLGAGIISFMPYVGALIGMAVGVLVAVFQFDGEIISIAMVLGVFFAGQLLEGNVVTPMLVGDKVNLHPVWMIFGLLAGGSLFGFVGVLMAVPVTAILGVLVRFAISEYLKSGYYKGKGKPKRKAAKA